MATIITKNSSTASSVPTNAQLVQGELAVNVTDKRLFTENASGTVVELGTNPSSLTLPNGTANGVAYLNGSKVVTTGSALTFDGTTFRMIGSGNATSVIETTGGASYQQIVANNAVNASYNAIQSKYGSTVDWYISGGNGTSGQIVFAPGNSEQMRLTSTGLGIGTSSPASKLHVYTSSGTADVRIQSNTYASSFSLYAGATGANAFGIYDNNASAYRAIIDSSGNLGLGVTPSAKLDVVATNFAGGPAIGARYNTSNARMGFNIANANGFPYIGYNTNNASASDTPTYDLSQAATQLRMDGGQFRFGIAPSGTAGNAISFTQAMTLDSSGNLLVGTTSTSPSSGLVGIVGNQAYHIVAHGSGSSSGAGYLRFDYNTAAIGSITQNGTTAVAFNTTSDHRLKENVTPLTGALAKVQALKPAEFDWVDGRHDDGFIAHELQAVLPNVVTGEKDAVDEDGKPKYQQVDYARIVPTLVAAIQELKAEFDAYKAAHP